MMRSALTLGLTLGASLGLLSQPAAAQDFYAGKRITVVVGSAPGGGYDIYGRLFAKHIVKHVPGSPTAVVQNMPGAGSLTAVKHLFVNAPQDGTTISSFAPALIHQSLSNPEVDVDFGKLKYIGSASASPLLCYSWHQSGINNLDDLTKKPFVIGTATKGASSYIGGRLLQSMLNAPVKLVQGYETNSTLIAIERRELDGDCGAWTNLSKDWLENKKVNLLVRFSKSVGKGMPDIPNLIDVVNTEEQKQIVALVTLPFETGRPFTMGPGVPDDRVTLVRRAFDKMVKDPEYLEDVEKMRVESIGPMTGEDFQKMVAGIYNTSKDIVVKATKAID
jgi:tripartite-type tricarboxylate transporter receptor subunit TctC